MAMISPRKNGAIWGAAMKEIMSQALKLARPLRDQCVNRFISIGKRAQVTCVISCGSALDPDRP